MRILVTGGAGFIGSHLCDHLLGQGHEVVAVDNFCTGSRRNIAHLADHPGFTFIECDITGGLAVDGKLDGILHFASPASPIDYQELPLETLRVGSTGTDVCLELARAHGARFILASTSEVYGDPEQHPQREDYWGNVNPVGPRSMYDEAKRYAEALTMAFRRSYGVNTGIVRIFNTFGPRMRINDGRVVPAFITQALLGEPLTVFGDGSQTRSFCYVNDLIEGIYRLFLSGEHDPVNLGNPQEMSIKQFAERVLEITRSEGPLVYRPLPENDPKMRRPDISRAERLLGWKPKVSLSQGLLEVVRYFQDVLIEQGREIKNPVPQGG
jgi:dTDP-glucose 4,6-dehydratase